MAKVSISSPWIGYARMIYALFHEDTDISMIYDDEQKEVKIYVANAAKAEAIARHLPESKNFGGVVLKISVIPANKKPAAVDDFVAMFAGNPIFKGVLIDDNPGMPGFDHVMFENKVVQYFNDCLNDPHGFESTLYEDIAREIFIDCENVFFNTEGDDQIELWP